MSFPSAEDLAGTWRLVRYVFAGPDGVESPRYAGGGHGLLHYQPEGRMSAHLSAENRGDALPREERPDYLGYAGAWRIEGGRVRHDVEMCSRAEWIGRVLWRDADLGPDGTLRLTAAGAVRDGVEGVAILDWRKIEG